MLSFTLRRLAGTLPGLLLLAALAGGAGLGSPSRAAWSGLERALAALPVTAALVAGALAVGLLAGAPLGLLAAGGPAAAGRRGAAAGPLVTALAGLGPAVPAFLAVALLYAAHPTTDGAAPLLALAALAVAPLTETARLARSALTTASETGYALAARGRGVPPGAVLRRHALPAALVPVAGALGALAGALAAAAVPAEALFGLPGAGALFLDAARAGDTATAAAAAAALGGLTLAARTLGATLCGWLDPRRRSG